MLIYALHDNLIYFSFWIGLRAIHGKGMHYIGLRDVWVWNSCLGQFLIYFSMKPCSRWVYETTGAKGHFTKYAAERRALESSLNPFLFQTGFGEIRAREQLPWGSGPFLNESVWLIFCTARGRRWLWTAFDATRGWTTCPWKYCGASLLLKWISDKLGLRNQCLGTQSHFLLKTVSSAIGSLYLSKNTSWMILGRSGELLFVFGIAMHSVRL